MNSQKILALLKDHQIKYQLYHHPAVYTSKQADQFLKDKDFARCKNLFLKTRNGQEFFLIILPENKKLDMKRARQELNSSALTFASEEELETKLGVKSGSVSPLNLLNDQTNTIHCVADQAAINENQYVGVHPNDNRQTVVLKWLDLSRFLGAYGHVFEERSF